MKWSALLPTFLLGVILGTAPAVAAEPRLPLHVLYVGNAQSARAAEYAAFLKTHCTKVTLADRASFDSTQTQDAAVVLLDWSQSDTQVTEAKSPLGRLEDWSKPTVLLGSAGLLLAGQWQIIGGAG
jgi:hypothetical protein